MDRSMPPIQRVSPEQADLEAVLALARAAEDADGDPPLSDQTLVDLRTEPERVLLAEASQDGRALAAAALVRSREQGAPALLEGVVDAQERGRGLGRRLVETILEDHDGPVDAWSHGDHPAARHLAQALGFEPVRELHRLLRTDALPERLPGLELPDGVVIRSFEPGRDDQELLRGNAAAFADHPEQGQLGLAGHHLLDRDLQHRAVVHQKAGHAEEQPQRSAPQAYPEVNAAQPAQEHHAAAVRALGRGQGDGHRGRVFSRAHGRTQRRKRL